MKQRSDADRPKRGISYIRVSTRRQALKPGNIAAQKEKCARVAQEYGSAISHEIVDPGIAGRYATGRKIRELEELIKRHHREIGFLVVEHTSRLEGSPSLDSMLKAAHQAIFP